MAESTPGGTAQTDLEVRTYLTCPDWCDLEVEKHRAQVHDEQLMIDHEGPRFGVWRVSGVTANGSLVAVELIGEADYCVSSAETMREIAAAATAAAEWLEGVR